MFSFLFILFCGTANVLSNPAISLLQCNTNDEACITNAVKAAYPLVLEPNAEIGAEEMDPMFHPFIEGNLSIIKFKLFNTSVTGFKTCEVESAKYNEAAESLQIELSCPAFTLKGQYDVNGRLIVLPVEGNGDYEIDTKKYHLLATLEIKTVTGKDGKDYKNIKSLQLDVEALEGVYYDFRNLFNGQKDLAENVLKFANENWKEVAHELQMPVFMANVKKIVKNANKYLKTLPIDEYTSQ